MNYITIDCGTTNTRVYLVSQRGEILCKAAREIGVRDTSAAGNAGPLKTALRALIEEVRKACPAGESIDAILSCGMITSEIGLRELPHLCAPCGVRELAAGLTQVRGLGLTPEEIPVYFVRGIKTISEAAERDPFGQVGRLDFMRGEETQVVGLLERRALALPGTVLVLSSHTKFIPVDSDGRIMGSLTTASGQAYAAILQKTFVGKSVRPNDGEAAPKDYFDERIVSAAASALRENGLLRCMMFPRFQDVLLDTKWYARKLFFEAAVAADDMTAMNGMDRFPGAFKKALCLVGESGRCRLYAHILRERFPGCAVECISDPAQIDKLSIDGVLKIARTAKATHGAIT